MLSLGKKRSLWEADKQTKVEIVVNTTWRCGLLEREIVKLIRRRSPKNVYVSDVVGELSNINSDKVRDSIRRLGKRKILAVALERAK